MVFWAKFFIFQNRFWLQPDEVLEKMASPHRPQFAKKDSLSKASIANTMANTICVAIVWRMNHIKLSKQRVDSVWLVLDDELMKVLSFTELSYPCFGVNFRAIPQQNPDNIRLIRSHRQMQRRLAAYCGHVGITAVLNQVQHNVHASHEWSHMQRSQSGLGRRLDGRPVFQQQFHDFDAIFLAGNVERREAVEGARVGVGTPVQQKFGHTNVAAVGCHVERGQVVHRDVVNRGFVVKQGPSAVHMVTLRGHMQGSQSILQHIWVRTDTSISFEKSSSTTSECQFRLWI